MTPLRIAIAGAESTGKSRLSQDLAKALRLRNQTVHVIDEVLRTWCEQHARTPMPQEQMAIAILQAEAAQQAPTGWVISDTTPLMTAVYSHLLFQDTNLYPMALADQAQFDVTLLMGLDMPWVADGIQRDGPQFRAAADSLIRQALDQAGLPYRVVYGLDQHRLNNAWLALGLPSSDPSVLSARKEAQFAINQGRTPWQCNECSDPTCEHKLFTALLKK